MAEALSTDWLGLADRVCVVTGAGGGIGRSVAVNLAKAGAQVAALDRDEQGVEKTRAEFASNRHVIALCDVTSADSIAAAAATIEKTLGPAQVLVNAAAILRSGTLDTLSLAAIESDAAPDTIRTCDLSFGARSPARQPPTERVKFNLTSWRRNQ